MMGNILKQVKTGIKKKRRKIDFFSKNLTLPLSGIKYESPGCFTGRPFREPCMEENLIRDIRVAEEEAAGIVASARDRAARDLREARSEIAGRADGLRESFLQRRNEELERGQKEGEAEVKQIEKETGDIIAEIVKTAAGRKESVLKFLTEKIME